MTIREHLAALREALVSVEAHMTTPVCDELEQDGCDTASFYIDLGVVKDFVQSTEARLMAAAEIAWKKSCKEAHP